VSQRTRDLVLPAAVGALLIATSLLPGCGGGSDPTSGAAPTPSPPAVTVPQILYNGAVGPTQSTLAQTLRLGDLSVSQLNSDNAALLGALLDSTPATIGAWVAQFFPGFRVNVAEHKTFVQVDESGAVAAAATGVGGTSVVSLSVNLQVNHPFFYAIRDNQTGELLFVGVLMNPSAG
jgi:serine protease inhibitor